MGVKIAVIFIFIAFFGQAQEQLNDLKYNPKLIQNTTVQNKILGVTYLVDTLELPFIDDFSQNRQHRYGNSVNLSFLDSSYAKFRLDGLIFDSISLNRTPTYSYYFSTITQITDTVEHLEAAISEFKINSAVVPADTIISIVVGNWLAYNYFYKDGNLLTVDTLIPDTILHNEIVPILLAYDSTALWLDNGAYINNDLAINPPTMGVATFDGIDSLGHPYDMSSENAYGVSDKLTAKPIRLKGKTDVILSFYYQIQGLGNLPEKKDSLVLEFLVADTAHADFGQWQHAWAVPGSDTLVPNTLFEYVEIAINSSKFLQDGFQFRFKNYATQSGYLDHWSIDYVYLDENRTANNRLIIKDLGFRKSEKKMINLYSSMPWNQFVAAPETYMNKNIEFELTNLSNQNISGSNTLEIFDMTDTTSIFTADVISIVIFDSIFGEFVFRFDTVPDIFSFPTDNSYRKEFKTVLSTTSNTLINQKNTSNDNFTINQVFDNYYAYDDGLPERAYSLLGAGAKLAYKFKLEEADTLTGMLIHVPEMFKVEKNNIKVTVWKSDNGVPGDTIYRGPFDDIYYVPDSVPVGFTRYKIRREIILPQGEFFIGFEQIYDSPFYVGFDKNNATQINIFYNVDGFWQPTTFVGSLMMRPEFGKTKTISPIYSLGLEDKKESNFTIYPNPTNGNFTIALENNSFHQLQIFNALGQVIQQETLTSTQVFDTSFWKKGIYLVLVTEEKTGVSFTEKLVVY